MNDIAKHVQVSKSGLRTLRIGSGEPLVLLHMGANQWTKWAPVLPYLTDRYDVLAPTLPGWRGGEPLPNPASVEAYFDSVERAMDHAGFETAHVAGCSLGGWATLEMARRGRARSGLAICPAGGSTEKQKQRVLKYFQLVNSQPRLRKLLAPVLLARPATRRATLRAILAHGERISARQAIALGRDSSDGDWDTLLPFIASPEFRMKPCPDLDVPFLIAWGEKDRFTPMEHDFEAWCAAVPTAESAILEGIGHIPMLDDPQYTGTFMRDWLARH